MSEQNVEIIRRIYQEGLFDSHPEGLVPLLSPDIEFVNPSEAVERGVRRGIDEFIRAHASIAVSFESSRHVLQELFSARDSVIASVSFRARPRGSESELVQEEAHSWTLRDGKIVRFEWGRDLSQALEAAGLSE